MTTNTTSFANSTVTTTTSSLKFPLNIPLETTKNIPLSPTSPKDSKDTPLSPPPNCRTPITQMGSLVSKYLNIPLENMSEVRKHSKNYNNEYHKSGKKKRSRWS